MIPLEERNCTKRMVRPHTPGEPCFSESQMEGPIIRIDLVEIYIDDPEYYETVYAPGLSDKWT
jgi:hypothetical protein